jgi:hypothetical protein
MAIELLDTVALLEDVAERGLKRGEVWTVTVNSGDLHLADKVLA